MKISWISNLVLEMALGTDSLFLLMWRLLNIHFFQEVGKVLLLLCQTQETGRWWDSRVRIEEEYFLNLFLFLIWGFYIQPGTETLVSMQVTGSTTTEGAISFFTPARRNCYTDQEFQPKYFNKVRNKMHKHLFNRHFQSTGFRYTMSNCLYASMIDKVETSCGCSPIFSSMGNDEVTPEAAVKPKCIGHHLKCMEVYAFLC